MEWTLGRAGSGAIYQTSETKFDTSRSAGASAEAFAATEEALAALVQAPPTSPELGDDAVSALTFDEDTHHQHHNTKRRRELSQSSNKLGEASGTISELTEKAHATVTRLRNALAAREKVNAVNEIPNHAAPIELLGENVVSGENKKKIVFKAYQQRTVSGGGLITKQLMCFWEHDMPVTQQCCIGKTSRKFSGAVWDDQELRTLLA